MEKKKIIIIDDIEIEVEFIRGSMLSEDELDKVCGGVVLPGSPEDTTVYQMVCKTCGWKSNWFTDYTKYETANILTPHISATSHKDFRCEEFSLPKG
jgi:hypothetical protein